MARDRTYTPKIPTTQKQQVTQDYLDDVRRQGREAELLLHNKLLSQMLAATKTKILDIISQQLLSDNEEAKTVNGVTFTMKFPADKEYLLLAGQYRFIHDFEDELTMTVKKAQQMEEDIKNELLEVKNAE